MKSVTLSTEEVVHFGPWKRKAARLFKQTLEKGVSYRQDMDTGKFDTVKEIPTENFDNAYEAVLSVVIQRIERAGADVPFSQQWLDDLEPRDYDLLEAAVSEMKLASRVAGKKILEQLRKHLEATIDPPPAPEEYEEFLLCGHFGCLPHELDEIEDGRYWQALGFLRVKRDADRLGGLQASFYS